MDENQISLTALTAAFVRSYHSLNDNPKIFDDFLAYSLLPPETRLNMEQNLPELFKAFNPERAVCCLDKPSALTWVIRNILNASTLLARAQYMEKCLEEEVNHRVKQYVNLGAGLDTFAFRKPELASQYEIFEIDHPSTQAFKRKQLTALGWKISEHLHLVPVDFTKDKLVDELIKSSYNPQKSSIFSWLGVTYYLTREVVLSTLRDIVNVSPAGSIVIFDYLDSEAFVPEKMARNVQIMHMIGQRVEEPLKSYFKPSSIRKDLETIGLSLIENLSPIDIQERYFHGRIDDYHADEHFHFARAVVV